MSSLQETPRESRSNAVEFVNMARPFSLQRYIHETFEGDSTISGVLECAKRAGARALVLETIESAQCIEDENWAIVSRQPTYKMLDLRRITFWRSPLPDRNEEEALRPEDFLGYAILKCDGRSSGTHWYTYESVVRAPFDPRAIVPNQTDFSVRCLGQDLTARGILFCGQDGISKSCAHTNLRSLCSLALGRDVSFHDITSAAHPRPTNPEHGLTVQQIHGILDALGVQYRSVDFTLKSARRHFPAPTEVFLPSVSAGKGALLGFPVGQHAIHHFLFLYGYTFEPSSLELVVGSAYAGTHEGTGMWYHSIAPWVRSFICSDDNFGPHYYLSTGSELIAGASFALTTLPKAAAFDGVTANAVGFVCLSYVIPYLSEHREHYWERQLQEAYARGDLMIQPRVMHTNEYTAYLSSVRDWSRRGVRRELLQALESGLRDNLMWVLEFSIPNLLASQLKLGEVLLNAEAPVPNGESSDMLCSLIAVRTPGCMVIPNHKKNGKPEFLSIESGMTEPAPLIQSGRDKEYRDMAGFDYDVALSFAGEDREVVEQVASKLKDSNVKVFYDRYEQVDLWGKDLYQHLQYVYRDCSRFCVVFISAAYAVKLWTRHELKQAQARAFQQNLEYILPVRLDDTAIPGINETVGYFDLRSKSVDVLVAELMRKLEMD